ncbi:unnamed protein product, partial [Allacma fusca]
MESRTKILEIMQVAANLIKSTHQTYTNFELIQLNFHSLMSGPDGNLHSTELEDNSYTPMGHHIPLYYLLAYLYRFVYHIIQRKHEGVSYQYPSLAVIWELKSPATCSAEAELRFQQFGDRFIGLGSSPETRFTKPEKQFMAEY